MEFGLFGIGDVTRDPLSGRTPSEFERLHAIARIAVSAEQSGFDVFAIGEHHNPPYVSSAQSTLLAYVAAKTSTITLSTSTTLITTNDPVRIAEEFATLQHLAAGRIDLMLGRGNTLEVYPWFGREPADGVPLALENYELLRRLWREEKLDWNGKFRTPLHGFTAVPRPLEGKPPFIWHGAVRSYETAELAALDGDGFFVNNLFAPVAHFSQYVQYYRMRYAEYGHGRAEDAIVGAGGGIFVRENSQDAYRDYEPYFRNSPLGSRQDLRSVVKSTGLLVGSPAEVIERVLEMREIFGPYQRQLFGVDFGGVPEMEVMRQLDIIGERVLPELRRATSGSADLPRLQDRFAQGQAKKRVS